MTTTIVTATTTRKKRNRTFLIILFFFFLLFDFFLFLFSFYWNKFPFSFSYFPSFFSFILSSSHSLSSSIFLSPPSNNTLFKLIMNNITTMANTTDVYNRSMFCNHLLPEKGCLSGI